MFIRTICLNGCRDRHCPKCNGMKREKWVAGRKADALPVSLESQCMKHGTQMYNLLFVSAWVNDRCICPAAQVPWGANGHGGAASYLGAEPDAPHPYPLPGTSRGDRCPGVVEGMQTGGQVLCPCKTVVGGVPRKIYRRADQAPAKRHC